MYLSLSQISLKEVGDSIVDKTNIIELSELKSLKQELTRFMMAYKFALDEMNTKINILKDEFTYIHDYNPIEHVKSRLKNRQKAYLEKWLTKAANYHYLL
jgi:ppGpp synthetase/RelA/SpoT-type nucleotidyltranferase